jgi:hypothetical protein
MRTAPVLLTTLLLTGAAAGETRGPETLVYTETLRMTGRGAAAAGPPALRPFQPPPHPGGIPVRVPPLRMTGQRRP